MTFLLYYISSVTIICLKVKASAVGARENKASVKEIEIGKCSKTST